MPATPQTQLTPESKSFILHYPIDYVAGDFGIPKGSIGYNMGYSDDTLLEGIAKNIKEFMGDNARIRTIDIDAKRSETGKAEKLLILEVDKEAINKIEEKIRTELKDVSNKHEAISKPLLNVVATDADLGKPQLPAQKGQLNLA